MLFITISAQEKDIFFAILRTKNLTLQHIPTNEFIHFRIL